MRLVLLPAAPGQPNGYSRVVSSDIERLDLGTGDDVVVRANVDDAVPTSWKRVPMISRASSTRIVNLALGRASAEVTTRQLRPLVDQSYEEIFCGDIVLYRAARALFPTQRMTVRLHNVFGLLEERRRRSGYRPGIIFRANMITFARLERSLFADPQAEIVFISDQDRDFYHRHADRRNGEVWSLPTPSSPAPRPPTALRLLYLGSLPSHQSWAVQFFVDHTWPLVRSSVPGIELHLHGRDTQRFDDPDAAVFGYGPYRGEALPQDGNGLFINPDLLGGGQKVKIHDWLAAGVAFISTPFGVDGYDIHPSHGRLVAEIDRWPAAIADYFHSVGLFHSPNW